MAECSICLDPCIQDSIRAPVTLICGHRFHLACIGCAFNFKGTMECPICQTRENSEWKYCSGDPSRPRIRINEDSVSNDPSDEDDDEESEELESPKKKRAKSMTAHEFKFKKTSLVKFSPDESSDDEESKDSSDDNEDFSEDESEELESPDKEPAKRLTLREFRILYNKRKKAEENLKSISHEVKESPDDDEEFSDDEDEEMESLEKKPAERMTAREYAKLFKEKKQVVPTEETSKPISDESKESSDDDEDLSDDENEEMDSTEKKPAKRMTAHEYAKLFKKKKTSPVKEAPANFSVEENSNPISCESSPNEYDQNKVEEDVNEAYSEPILSSPKMYAVAKREISDVGVTSEDMSVEKEVSSTDNGSSLKKRKFE